ncbi:MAG: DUF3565 domain-containing protein [Acidimicrobiales bacterium]
MVVGCGARFVGSRRDEAGDRVAELSCLHLRHRPPFQERPWGHRGGRGRVGAALDCA